MKNTKISHVIIFKRDIIIGQPANWPNTNVSSHLIELLGFHRCKIMKIASEEYGTGSEDKTNCLN